MTVDCHQHLWPPVLIDALRRRRRSPRLDGWTLLLDGEPPFEVPPADHSLPERAAAVPATGCARALVSLSSPLGIEALPPEEARPLLDAWHDGAGTLGPDFGVWAAAGTVEPDVWQLKDDLSRKGVVGLQLPATELATPAGWERLGDLLEVLEGADLPLLVHPGPVTEDVPGAPGWWPAVVPYVAQLHSAWAAWHVGGRAAHPGLRVAFVALAGLAPLHHERLAARGGRFGRVDPGVFYETSSYGPRAVDAMLRVVGVDALVLGTDAPYAGRVPFGLGAAFEHALGTANPRRLLHGERSST